MASPDPSHDRHGCPVPKKIAAVAIGASAGGVQALLDLLGPLPHDFRLPLLVVLHIAENRGSLLAPLFGQRLRVAVCEAEDKMRIAPGTVYFAPPGYHLLVESDRTLALSCEAPVLFSRPSIDVLLESAAAAYGPALAAMVLTGASEDGAAGLAAVGRAGGFTAVQDPLEAQMMTMPAAAVARRAPNRILSLHQLHQLLMDLNAHALSC